LDGLVKCRCRSLRFRGTNGISVTCDGDMILLWTTSTSCLASSRNTYTLMQTQPPILPGSQ